MNASIERKIIIRHVSGSKANQIEEFPLSGRTEFRIGRDPASDIVYDSVRDDVVSRNHAVIAVSGNEPPTFTIADSNSSNGTFLNKEQIFEKKELLPDDTVMFGKNGPAFTFDLQPRLGAGARTRIVDVVTPTATRVVSANEAATAVSLRAATRSTVVELPPDDPDWPAAKTGIGKDTLLHELAKERSTANRTWFSVLGGLAVVVAIVGAGLYWKVIKGEQAQQKSLQDIKRETEAVKQQGEEAEVQTAAGLKQRLGMNPQDIVRQYGTATAKLTAHWRLFDQTTGRPIFQKTYIDKDKTYGMYVKLENGTIVPDLVLDDENRHNRPIEGQIAGTAFVVSDKGFLLTNKRLAAAWRLPFFDSESLDNEALLLDETTGRKKSLKVSIINLNDNAYKSLRDWVPESGGLIFDAKKLRVVGAYNNIPDPSKNEQHNFEGRNEDLEVTFTGKRLGINASLVRSSNESDAALIKIDSPEPLQTVDVATTDDVAAGDQVIVLGFPAVAAPTYALSDTIVNGRLKTNEEIVPQPYVTDGIVALVSNKITTRNGLTVEGAQGDIIQLTINATGAGNSGGPVFNSAGKVIGLFTYSISQGTARSSAAVPIKYGRELLKSQ
jgi:serine protease Do